eukprot:13817156-Ditylum_brightwellii.AAC.1
MIQFKDMFNRNVKLTFLLITKKETTRGMYKIDSSVVYSSLSSAAQTPKNSNTSAITDDRDFNMSNTLHNKDLPSTEIREEGLKEHEDEKIISSSHPGSLVETNNIAPLLDDMQCNGVE